MDLDRFQPATRAAESGRPVILSFRAGTELYNLDLVLDAFRVVRRRLPDATLVLLHGDAPLAERVQVRLDELVGMASCRSPRAFRTRRWPTTCA